ncbi:MAG: hypothetical protein H6585_04435 [Flavobacteriales bacterium]|nr:hypothetical protein [Flavobacteriales bacterium]MCB9447574.1 hypothetical protein [Flavobacteriales bacterium]
MAAIFTFIFVSSVEGVTMYAEVGVFVLLYAFLQWFSSIGRDVPIRWLIVCVALVQWVVAPFLSYHFFTESEFYGMVIDETEYMNYVVPATLAYSLILLLPLGRKKANWEVNFSNDLGYIRKAGRLLYIVGILSYLLRTSMPASLGYFFGLMQNFSIIGAMYLYLANVQGKMIWLILSFAPVLINAGESSVFHDLILWGGYLFMLYAFIDRITVTRKVVLTAAGLLMVVLIQSIKKDYRTAIFENDDASKTELIMEIAGEKLEENQSEDFWQAFVDRLNQGWIIARIMDKVPSEEPYAMGKTISDGVRAAFVPRILDPNKPKSGGGENFEKYTGIALRGASMNLGLVGEAYANFGRNGGILFMAIYGLFFNLVFRQITRVSYQRPEIILWVPFLFFYVVKAEDDFLTAFNQFMKSAFLVVAVLWYMKRFRIPPASIEEESAS